ncbi:NAD(+) synthase [Allobaculum sp. JKK-2023]|uniref:NAD(+) synthase n=1 Tax=Allobaculum sp. JKK-2023 TaxID=3108943 RepID=UPI002B05296C|nr:NAD(+) synthase [Allobaculum sp. JKK-2023]
MNRYSYYEVCAMTPPVQIANPMANARAILDLCQELPETTRLVVTPELSLTGYTCQDLFYESLLQHQTLQALEYLTRNLPDCLSVLVGLPLQVGNHLYNTAAFITHNEVKGFYAKTYLPNYNEYYEQRWFASSLYLPEHSQVHFMNKAVPVTDKILFEDYTTGAVIGAEICEDLWVSIPVSSHHACAGANVLCNLSASNEVISKDEYRKNIVREQSARNFCAYLYASAGPDESSSDLVFGGQDIIAENGKVLAQSSLQNPKPYLLAQIDLEILRNDRLHYKTTFESLEDGYVHIPFASKPVDSIELYRPIDPYPFVLQDEKSRIERCQNILAIQARGLATRLSKIHATKVVIGISGGLDSTLALLVCAKAFELLHLDPKGIIAITMPGFGTTSRTKSNAQKLMELLGVTAREIPIGEAVLQHFKDIGQDESVHDITYENSQARERTQILMDVANKENALVIGTGDLSELALGWCTYNGDHMSMYGVNVSVPKTLVRYIVESDALNAKAQGNLALYDVLMDICATPVSPELLPPDQEGKIAQKTEEVLGSYDLHDFFLYHMLRFHESPAKIYDLACHAFKTVDPKTLLKALRTFYTRFFSQQFKRNCMPDGVKVGSVNFSPRGDWRMPSDASRNMWLAEVEKLEGRSKEQ